MNKDQIKGAAKETAGKVQQQMGKATGSVSQQAKGVTREAAGKLQKGVGNIKQAAAQADKKTR